MSIRTTAAFAAVSSFIVASGASAQVFRGLNGATTTLHGGDRELNSLSFVGASNSMNGLNFARFSDGSLTTYVAGVASGPHGWNSPVARDVSTSGNRVTGNPDRADDATNFLGEETLTGTISEVFGAGRLGYKNLSWIIDGESADGAEDFTLDLFFAPGVKLSGDNSSSTVEFAFLERGGNSDFRIYGITAERAMTAGVLVSRELMTPAGWSLNTLEIGSSQGVSGVGLSIDSGWKDLIGIRIVQEQGFNGPDIVGVGVAGLVPAPGVIVLSALSGMMAMRRPRR